MLDLDYKQGEYTREPYKLFVWYIQLTCMYELSWNWACSCSYGLCDNWHDWEYYLVYDIGNMEIWLSNWVKPMGEFMIKVII
jgi:hypothetical protein